jgi:hypothetical protein
VKSISLRTPVRKLLKIKQTTRIGELRRIRAIERIFEEPLRERPSKISAVRLLDESRR